MVKENLSFQAEVGKLLHLVTHSLYKDKQIFLREIIRDFNLKANVIEENIFNAFFFPLFGLIIKQIFII